VSVETVKVPQHLELEDVVAWGLGDLLFVLAGAAGAWWLYLAIPGDVLVRVAIGTPAVLAGVSMGILRLGDISLRAWMVTAARYARRPRVLMTGGGW
jgi:hypothetical protein